MRVSGYKFSRSRKALGFNDGRLVIRVDGFAGNVYWLAKVDGAADPVIPPRISSAVSEADPDMFDLTKPHQVVRRARRSHGVSGPVDIGPIERNPHSGGFYLRRLTDALGNPWPFAINPFFAEHIERCWPIGSWRVLASGELLRIQWERNRPVLRAVCMSIRLAGR